VPQEEIIWLIAFGAVAVPIGLLIFSLPAIQAKRRGYSFFVWLIAGLLAYNPIYLLVVLATVPHRKRQRLRAQFANELDAKLAAAGIPAVRPISRPVGERSLGDQPTMDPGSTVSRPAVERSIGDEATRM